MASLSKHARGHHSTWRSAVACVGVSDCKATAWAEVQFRPEKGVWEVVQSDTSSHPDAMNSPEKEMVLGLCTFGLWIGVVLRSG